MRTLALFTLLVFATLPLDAQEIWQALDAPTGGQTRALLPIDDEHILATTGRGLFVTNDGGATWRQSTGLRSGWAQISVGASGTIYAVQFNGRHADRHILYRSTNTGASFEIVGDTTAEYPQRLDGIVESSGDGDLLLPGFGLWRYDAGENRMTKLAAYPYRQSLLRGGTLFAWSGTKLVRASIDAPSDTVVLSPPEGAVLGLLVTPEGAIMALGGDVTPYRSFDSGATWQSVWDRASGQIQSMCLDSSGGILLVSTTGVGYRSSDLGETWQRLSAPGVTTWTSFHVGPEGRIGAITIDTASRHNEYVSTDRGATWSEVPFENPAVKTRQIISTPGSPIMLASESGYLRSSDDGATWEPIAVGGQYHLGHRSLTLAPDGVLYDGDNAGRRISKSTDGGLTWSTALEGAPGRLARLQAVGVGRFVGVTFEGAIRTFSESDTLGLSYQTSTRSFVTGAIAVDSSGVFHVGRDSNMYRSNDGGLTWTRTAVLPFMQITNIAAAPSGTLFATGLLGAGSLARSTDRGLSWSVRQEPALGEPTMIAAGPSGAIYLGTRYRGVLRSTDDGVTWHDYSTGLPEYSIDDITFSDDGNLYAIATGAGVYKGAEGVTSSVGADDATSSSILSIAPNPASSEATIYYTLTRAATVSLGIYTALGERVATVAEGSHAAGAGRVRFSTEELAAGIYFVRLEIDGVVSARRLVVR